MKITAYTDGGSVELNYGKKDWIGGWGLFIKEENGSELRFNAGMPIGSTNNRAEMGAYRQLITEAIARGYTEIKVFIDSQYVINGATKWISGWKKKKWIKSDGERVVNEDIWKEIDALQTEATKRGIKIDISWVKGHSGIEGNEVADQLATAGIAQARNEDFSVQQKGVIKDEINTSDEADTTTEKPKKVKKPKVPLPHPLICGRRLMDVVNKPIGPEGQNVYYTLSFDDTDDIKSRFCGVASSERFEGVVVCNERLPLYHELHALQTSNIPEDFAFPVLYMWDKISSSARWKEFYLEGIENLHLDHTGDLYHWDKDTQLSHVLRTPRAAKFSLDTLNNKHYLLSEFLAGTFKDEKVMDVTDYIYTTNSKGKMEARPELAAAKRLDHRFTWNEQDALIAMAIMYEIPSRNVFARLAKEDKEVKVSIVIHDESKTTFRWSLVVTTPNAAAIYNNPSRNLIVMP